MNWHFHPYAVVYLINALFAALFSVFAWRRRSIPGITAFAFLMLAIVDWTFLRALEAMAIETWAKVFWAKLEYTGIASVGVLWLFFSARFSDQDEWITKKTVGLLWVIPILTVLVALSNDWHWLLWTSITPNPAADSDFLIYHHGPWFWVIFSYTYMTLLLGSFLLIRAISRYPRLYRHQMFPLLLGAAIPWIGNLIYVTGHSPMPGVDLTPFSFTIVGFIYYWSIFRTRLFEIVPIARDLLIENITDGMIVLDNTGRIVDLNTAARRYLTDTPAPIGKDAREVFDWLPPAVTRPSSRSVEHSELTVERDSVCDLTLDIYPLIDRYSTHQGHLIMIRDITEQKKSQKKLAESERRYREHVEEIGDIVYVLDGNRNLKYINNALVQLIGDSIDHGTLKNFKEIVTTHSYNNLRGHFEDKRSRKGKRIFEIEFRGIQDKGRTFEVSEKCITDGGGDVEIHGIGRDITGRKKAEEQRKKSEEHYRELVENIDDIVYVTDSTGKITYLNGAFERISGYKREEMLQKNYMDLLTPESLKAVHELFNKQRKGQDIGTFEMSFFSKDRTVKTIEVREKQIFRDNRIIEVQGLGRDVTEKRRTELQLLQSEKLSAVGTMISGVAHELNNPLTSIIGNAQLISRREVPQDIKDKLTIILKESIRSSKIVGGLLAFAREHKPERKMININDILHDSVRLREYDLKVSNINMRLSLSDDLPETYADPFQIQQVFINLINNARDALNDRDRAALVLRTYRKNDSLFIEFEDNGMGIPEDLVDRIFDPFFTTKAAGKGTGLGLSMSYGIIREHGGDIEIENNPGKGVKFVVILPIIQGEKSAAEKIKAPTKSPTGTKTVLIAEDEQSLRAFLSEALTEAGFLVEIVSTGEEAIDLIDNRKYDAIISDIKMPGISGKELYLHVQKYHPEIAKKIIFITGDVLSKDTASFFQTITNKFIEKPFVVDSLVELLNEVTCSTKMIRH